MSWLNKVSKIVCLNLAHREDRLLQFTEQMETYEIPFKRIESIYDVEQGARGLRDTMLDLFRQEIANKTEHLLVFEDDCQIIIEPLWFHEIMNNVFEQLPPNYHLCYLGGQASGRFSHLFSPNLIPVVKYFSTHSVMYSLQGMKEIMAREMQYPIDNWLVDTIQILGHCYCIDPLLCSQFAGFSDIGRAEIDWYPFIVPRHEQKKAEMNGRR